MFLAWANSLSGEKCSQKLVTQNAAYAPVNARFRLSTSSRSAAAMTAPSLATAFALSDVGWRVRARAAKPPLLSLTIARTTPPPCAPVAPTIAMTFLSAMARLLLETGTQRSKLRRVVKETAYGDVTPP